MNLTSKQKQQLKARAHKLNPVVIVGGNGLTENVNNEIDQALNIHELIKIRVNSEDRDERRAVFEEIGELHKANLVQIVGKIGILFRKNPEA